jgi:hypothetical protein
MDLVNHPELLEQPKQACMSAAWFLATKGLNNLADPGGFNRITCRINGGLDGLQDRLEIWGVHWRCWRECHPLEDCRRSGAISARLRQRLPVPDLALQRTTSRAITGANRNL